MMRCLLVFICCCFLTGNAEVLIDTCGVDFIYFRGRCYWFSSETADHTTAQKACRAMGAQLVSIGDQEEQDFVVERYMPLTSRNFWIGLSPPKDFPNNACSDTDCIRQGWTWDDGTTYNHTFYHFWGDSYPRGVGVCPEVEPSVEFKWVNVPCNSNILYTCEKGDERIKQCGSCVGGK